MTVEKLSNLRLERRFDSSPERVFDAWLNPETVKKWLFTTAASEKNTTEVDARVGGKWTIVDRREGVDYRAVGEYIEIDRPRRLVFRFGMPQFSPEFVRVIVEIEPEGTGSLLTLTHERVPESYVSETERGWSHMFVRLEQLLDEPAAYAVMTGEGAVRLERVLSGPVQRVWAYLTESDKRGKWLASGQMELRAGGAVTLKFHHADLSSKTAQIPEEFKEFENGAVTEHKVIRFEPPYLLSLAWGGGVEGKPSEVTFELRPQGDKVQLVLTHRLFGDRSTLANCSCGWHTHLAILADCLNDREPEAFWSIFGGLNKEYEKRFADNP